MISIVRVAEALKATQKPTGAHSFYPTETEDSIVLQPQNDTGSRGFFIFVFFVNNFERCIPFV